MKKLSLALLSAVSLVALTTGCSSSEVIEEGPALQTGAITFGATNVAKASRAQLANNEVLTNTNFSDFYVYGAYKVPNSTNSSIVNIFSGVEVFKKDGNWMYTDGGNRYWIPGATYNFYGFSCANGADVDETTHRPKNATFEDGILTITNLECTDAHQHDLVFAAAKNEVRGNFGDQSMDAATATAVNLKFKHILTRLKFSFLCSTPGADYDIIISKAYITGMYTKADYTSNEVWMNLEQDGEVVNLKFKGGITEGNVPEDVAGAEPLECNSIFVVPNKYEKPTGENEKQKVSLVFTMQVKYKGEDVLGRTVEATWTPDWEQGESLNNIVKIDFKDATGLQPIRFSASIATADPDVPTTSDGWVIGTGGIGTMVFSSEAEVNK